MLKHHVCCGKKTGHQTVFFMSKAKKPFYGLRTKEQVVREYLGSTASMSELSELYGVLGSNTISNWQKKFGNSPAQKPPGMEKGEDGPSAVEKDMSDELEMAALQHRIAMHSMVAGYALSFAIILFLKKAEIPL